MSEPTKEEAGVPPTAWGSEKDSSTNKNTQEFMTQYLMKHTPRPDSIKHFESIPWTRKLLEDPAYKALPTFSRIKKATGEDRFFAETICTPDTINHLVTLALKEYPFNSNPTGSSISASQAILSSNTTTTTTTPPQNTEAPPSQPGPLEKIIPPYLAAAVQKVRSLTPSLSQLSDSVSRDATYQTPMSLNTLGSSCPPQPETLTLIKMGSALDGHPGVIHGGICSSILDETMGYVVMLHQRSENGPRKLVFTAGLTIRFRAPVPSGTELLVKCWLVRKEGERKWFTRGQIVTADGKVCTDAEALWIVAREKSEKL